MRYIAILSAVCTLILIACQKDTEPPIVEITDPATGTVINDDIEIIEFRAEDNEIVASVDIFVDDSLIATNHYDTSYVSDGFFWNTGSLPDSSVHTIFARAYDGAQNEGISDTIVVIVIHL